MDIRDQIAKLVVEDKGLSDSRLRMILRELKNSKSHYEKSNQEQILIDACLNRINKFGSKNFYRSISSVLIELQCNISIQRAGQIMASNGIKRMQCRDGSLFNGYYL